MDLSEWIVRRANVDDLGGLKTLWERAGLQVLDLERRLTEFQLASSRDGDLGGALALQVAGKHGLLHSEAFVEPASEDQFRALLWERMKTLARNHGLVRLWTQEQAPFWHREAGFVAADPDGMKKLPASFSKGHRPWLTLVLREEAGPALTLEQEFELFQQASRVNTEEMLERARRMRIAAFIVGGLLFLVALGIGAYVILRWMRESRGLRPRTR